MYRYPEEICVFEPATAVLNAECPTIWVNHKLETALLAYYCAHSRASKVMNTIYPQINWNNIIRWPLRPGTYIILLPVQLIGNQSISPPEVQYTKLLYTHN